jgi:hypothetical protein
MCQIPRLPPAAGRSASRLDFDATGRIIGRARFATVLAPTPDCDQRQRFGWNGRHGDPEVSLQYNRARCFDPTRGRWLDDA